VAVAMLADQDRAVGGQIKQVIRAVQAGGQDDHRV
jgi:hypothetical protein